MATIPTIDISSLFGSDREAKLEVARAIDAASRPPGLGFFFVSGHGVRGLEQLLQATAQFHCNVTEEDARLLAAAGGPKLMNRVGFSAPKKGKGKEPVQAFVYTNPRFTADHPKAVTGVPFHAPNVWPDEAAHPGFRRRLEEFYKNVTKLGAILLQGYALALEQPEHFFEPYFRAEETLSFVRLIYCPAQLQGHKGGKKGEDGVRVSVPTHVDPSLITIIFQPHVANLQAQLPLAEGGGYLDIPASSTKFLVHAGGYMTHITGGHYPAPPHRVKFVTEERYAMPFFLGLGYDTKIPRLAMKSGGGEAPCAEEEVSFGKYLQEALEELCNGKGGGIN